MEDGVSWTHFEGGVGKSRLDFGIEIGMSGRPWELKREFRPEWADSTRNGEVGPLSDHSMVTFRRRSRRADGFTRPRRPRPIPMSGGRKAEAVGTAFAAEMRAGGLRRARAAACRRGTAGDGLGGVVQAARASAEAAQEQVEEDAVASSAARPGGAGARMWRDRSTTHVIAD